MAPRIIGADEAHGMLEGTTEGPWQFHAPEGASSAWVTQARDRDGVPLAILDGVIEANGRLMAASWELAHTVVRQSEELARLRAIVDNVRAEREARVAWLESQPRDVGNGPVPNALLPLLEAELRTGLMLEELDEFNAQKGGDR